MAKALNGKNIFALSILVAAMLFSLAILARAQNAPAAPAGESGIVFPVAELGNCTSKDACKTYCNDPANMQACIAFAQSHGLMNDEEANRAQKFSKTLQSGGGPGGCKSPAECDAFCGNISNIEACVTFAEKNGFKDQNAQDGKKVLQYVKSGGKFPGGCTSKESCQAYCEDFSHIEECSDFAEKSGLGPPPGENGPRGGPPPSPENMKKMVQLVKNGETPGGCKSKSECDSYCSDSSHIDACVSFGIRAGFIKPEEAEMIKKTGGKGPGGCTSKESCDTFCNSHQEECFKFAEEHNMMPPEELARAKQGMVQLRAGIEQAPPEVRECLEATMGPNIIDDIQSGKLTPGPQIGDRVRSCFDKFGESGGPREMFKNAPPEVMSCLKEKLGDTFAKIQNGEEMPTPEMADVFRVCFQSVQFQQGFSGQGGQGGEEHNGFTECGITDGTVAAYVCGTNGNSRGAPTGAGAETTYFNECHAKQQGAQIIHDEVCIRDGKPDVPCSNVAHIVCGTDGNSWTNECNAKEAGAEVRHEGVCTKEDRGQNGGPNQQNGPGGNFQNFLQSAPPGVASCLSEKLGGDFEKIKSGESRPTQEMGAKMKECFGQFRPENDMMRPPSDSTSFDKTQDKQGKPMDQEGQNFGPPRDGQSGGGPQGQMPGFNPMQSIPPQVRDCVKAAVGSDVFSQMEQGQKPTGDIGASIKTCYDQIRGSAVGSPGQYPAGSSSPQYPEGQYQPMPYQQMMPGGAYPSGTYQPAQGGSGGGAGGWSGGTYPPPPQEGQYQQPSGEMMSPAPMMEQQMSPPPSETTAPSSFLDRQSVLGLILTPLSPILNLFVR